MERWNGGASLTRNGEVEYGFLLELNISNPVTPPIWRDPPKPPKATKAKKESDLQLRLF